MQSWKSKCSAFLPNKCAKSSKSTDGYHWSTDLSVDCFVLFSCYIFIGLQIMIIFIILSIVFLLNQYRCHHFDSKLKIISRGSSESSNWEGTSGLPGLACCHCDPTLNSRKTIACSCTSRLLSCVHKDDPMTGTRGTSVPIRGEHATVSEMLASLSFSKILQWFVVFIFDWKMMSNQ